MFKKSSGCCGGLGVSGKRGGVHCCVAKSNVHVVITRDVVTKARTRGNQSVPNLAYDLIDK